MGEDTDKRPANSGPTWRVIGGICLMIIGSLLMLIYSNLNARMDKSEEACRDAHERVKAVETSQADMKGWLQRIEAKLDKAIESRR